MPNNKTAIQNQGLTRIASKIRIIIKSQVIISFTALMDNAQQTNFNGHTTRFKLHNESLIKSMKLVADIEPLIQDKYILKIAV